MHFLPVDNDMVIGWNRYFPSSFILNQTALALLDRIKESQPLPDSDPVRNFLVELKKHRFIYEARPSDQDPSRADFVSLVHRKLEDAEHSAYDFYRLKQDYADLKLVNDSCNLCCSYCVGECNASPAHPRPHRGMSLSARLRTINRCVDQFFSRKLANDVHDTKIFLNGGEILVDWNLIKKIIPRISQKFPSMKIDYQVNTNLTLLTEEIAGFFHRFGFRVHTSIDGYPAAHDRSRVYRSGKGSFADIIKNVELARKYPNISGLKVFQGTIENIKDFDPEEVYKMDRFGFVKARLAPNLLNISVEEAREKARLMGRFLVLNTGRSFQVTESMFTRLKNRINQQDYGFDFNCPGLSSLPRLGIEVNLSTLAVSHLCGFIKAAAVPLEDLGFDIYHPKLWEVSSRFLRERMDTLLSRCMECPLTGICAGGCILSGIDRKNRLNPAACAYQQEMWEIYVKKAFRDRKRVVPGH